MYDTNDVMFDVKLRGMKTSGCNGVLCVHSNWTCEGALYLLVSMSSAGVNFC